MTIAAKIQTEAEDGFARSFAQAGFGATQRAAFERFARAGLPTRRLESWHYSDLRGKLRAAPPLAATPGPDDLLFARAERDLRAAPETLKLVLLDGVFCADLSDQSGALSGLRIRALASLPSADPAAILLAELAALAEDPLLDLNAAFARDGVVIEIAEGAQIAQPIEILALCGATGAQSRFSRNLVCLGAGAKASLLETRAEGVGGFGDSALFLALGLGAELDYACRSEGGAPVDVQNIVARLDEQAQLRAAALVTDAPFLRRQWSILCRGENAEVQLSGAALLSQQNHADTTLTMIHDAPSCVSRETFKYVLADQANGVFQGRIVVPPHAQKTDGKMMCRGLLLSDDASMSVKPELEIFADDVACGHGAACAKLDAAQIFYMESRGVPKPQAQAILIEAFASETFDILHDDFLREILQADLARILATGVFA
jgi:Fe-S cluster assembly protein SufD